MGLERQKLAPRLTVIGGVEARSGLGRYDTAMGYDRVQ